MRNFIHELAAEGIEKQRLGRRIRQTARLKIKDLVFGEAAAGRAVTAGDIVGEDLKLRLRVHRHHVGEQQRLAEHLAVGLLGARGNMDLALEDADRFVVENVAEGLAALAARRAMLHEKRRIRMFLAAQKRHAAQRRLGVGAIEAHEYLPPHETAAGDQRKAVERRLDAELHHEAFEPDAARRRIGQSERMADIGLVADDNDQLIVGLANAATGAEARFADEQRSAFADEHQRAGEARHRRVRGGRIDRDGSARRPWCREQPR